MNGERDNGSGRFFPAPLILLATVALCFCAAAGLWALSRMKQPISSTEVKGLALGSGTSSRSRSLYLGMTVKPWQDPGAGEIIEPRQEPASESPRQPAVTLKLIPTDQLIAQTRSTNDRWLKADLIEEIASRGAGEGSSAISTLLVDQDRDVRRVAADALAELGDPVTLSDLTRALPREKDGRVRAALVEAIDELRQR